MTTPIEETGENVTQAKPKPRPGVNIAAVLALVAGVIAWVGWWSADVPVAILLLLIAAFLAAYVKEKWLSAITAGNVVACLLILALVHRFPPARELAKGAVCGSILHGLGKAMVLYEDSYDGVFPPRVEILVDEGHISRTGFKCPTSGKGWDEHTPLDTCFFIHFPSKGRDGASPATLVACDRTPCHDDGRNVLLLRGNVIRCTKEEFREKLRQPENAEFAEAFRREVGER